MDGIFAWLAEYSYAFVLAAAAIDATALPFPGRAVLVAAGMLAAAGRVDVFGSIAAGVVGVVAGDHLWYFGGRLAGGRLTALYRRLARRYGGRLANPTEYVQRHGSLTILIGRFVAVVRVLAWPVASAHGIRYGRFLAWDLAAATLWSGALVLAGFVFGGPALRMAGRLGGPAAVLAAALAGALAIGLLLLLRRRARRSRARPGRSRP